MTDFGILTLLEFPIRIGLVLSRNSRKTDSVAAWGGAGVSGVLGAATGLCAHNFVFVMTIIAPEVGDASWDAGRGPCSITVRSRHLMQY